MSWRLFANKFGYPLTDEYIRQTKVNKFTISYILKNIEEVELAIGKTSALTVSPKRRSYRIFKRWIVSEPFLSSELVRRLARRPARTRGSIRSFTDILKARFLAHRLDATFGFEAAYVKSNLRTFYFNVPTPFTVKIFPRDDGRVSSLENEVRTRERVSQLASKLHIPRITCSHVDAVPSFFAEDLLPGRKPTRECDLLDIHELLSGVWDLYLSSGIHFESTREWMPAPGKSIDAMFRSLGIDAIAAQFQDTIEAAQDFAHRVHAARCLIPVSLGHGDLTMSNMLKSDGVLYLLDWERSARMPIAFDMAKIALLSDDIIQLCEDNNATLDWPAGVNRLSFREQIALYSTRHLLNIDSRYVSIFRHKYNSAGIARHFARKHLTMLSETLPVSR